MTRKAQCELWKEQFDWDAEYDVIEWGRVTVIICQVDCAWAMSSSDFETMSVTPSIDASAAGHWHGYVTNGEIVGGEQL